MFIFLFMTDLFSTNTKDRTCTRPLYMRLPPVLAHQKSLTKEYKPRAYSQRFTVLYITYFNNIITTFFILYIHGARIKSLIKLINNTTLCL
jgi:hypothetical protein